ncbi:MAG: type II toxin-antitoxin system RelE/ParE family toxin [Hyphomicrobiaceae bacterium]
MTVLFRDEALEDLDEIARFIARDNPMVADWIIARIHEVIYDTLDAFPESGRRADSAAYEFAVPHLPYLIVYLPREAGIDVVGVFHTARDPHAKYNRRT